MCTLADVGGWSLGGVYKYLGAVRDVGDGADRQGKKEKRGCRVGKVAGRVESVGGSLRGCPSAG